MTIYEYLNRQVEEGDRVNRDATPISIRPVTQGAGALKILKSLLNKSGLGRMSAGEYQANLNGLNMFFGAVLGFVLAGTEKLGDLQFGIVLMILASIVITILFISSSRNRVMYALMALIYATTFPEIIDFILRGQDLVPGKIRPTLIAWTLMAIAVEFWGREDAPQTATTRS